MSISQRQSRQAGWGLVETAIALAVVSVLVGTVGVVVRVLTHGTAEVSTQLNAQQENNRARQFFLDDLQTTDSLNRDEFGNPYVQVASVGSGTDNALAFRKVSGYQVVPGEDRVTPVYGSEVRYFVDSDGNLLRTQDGATQFIARNVNDLRFQVSPKGVITIDLSTEDIKGDSATRLATCFRIVPRNTQSI